MRTTEANRPGADTTDRRGENGGIAIKIFHRIYEEMDLQRGALLKKEQCQGDSGRCLVSTWGPEVGGGVEERTWPGWLDSEAPHKRRDYKKGR